MGGRAGCSSSAQPTLTKGWCGDTLKGLIKGTAWIYSIAPEIHDLFHTVSNNLCNLSIGKCATCGLYLILRTVQNRQVP